jgi:hypothetical protein
VQSISEFKETMIAAMDIDIFVSLQNGNLINIFAQDELIAISGELDLSEFKASKLYKQTYKTDLKQQNLFLKIAHAFNNFKDYLRDSKIVIDYTYLWDLISRPNPKLFKKGLNLAIVEMNNNDITNNVSIICPSNHYATTFFDDYKYTVLLIKREKQFENNSYMMYEPIYAIEEKKNERAVTYAFMLNSLVNINNTIELIKQSYSKCRPYPSMPTVYEFKKNISLERLVDLLDLKSYAVLNQVTNFNGQVIGVIAQKTTIKQKGKANEQTTVLKGYLPCFPSAVLPNSPAPLLMMDADYSQTYAETMNFLNTVYKEFNGRIPCKPRIKVIEDEFIVGVITETNQFIMLSAPVPWSWMTKLDRNY